MQRTHLLGFLWNAPRHLAVVLSGFLVMLAVGGASPAPHPMPQSVTAVPSGRHSHLLLSPGPPSETAVLICNVFARAEQQAVSEDERRRLAAAHPIDTQALLKRGMHAIGSQEEGYRLLYAACLHPEGIGREIRQGRRWSGSFVRTDKRQPRSHIHVWRETRRQE